MMQTVSILGCGWFGKPLAISLLKKDFIVKVSTRTSDKKAELENLGLQHFSIDIANHQLDTDFFKASTLVVAITSKSVTDFKNLCQIIDASPIQKVIFISSTSVYKDENKEVFETSNLADNELVAIEKEFQKLQNTAFVILRFAGLMGYNRHPANWFQNKKIPQPNGFVNMIHVEDCIAVTQQLIQNSLQNEIFNVCSNHHPTRKDFYTKAKAVKNLPTPEFIENEPLSFKVVNSDKLQKLLSFQYQFDNLFNLLAM